VPQAPSLGGRLCRRQFAGRHRRVRARAGPTHPRVRCLLRIGRRGISTACIEGMLASAAPVLAVMDGDLQHDETRLPAMLRAIREDGADLVVGTRYGEGGCLGEWDASRARMSRLATRLSRLVGGRDVSDPMSGFFMLRREILDRAVRKLSGLGFKILLDLLASTKGPLTIVEVPYLSSKASAPASPRASRLCGRHSPQLLAQQRPHVPRPAAYGRPLAHRPPVLRGRVQRGSPRLRRRRRLRVRVARDGSAPRSRGSRWGGVERGPNSPLQRALGLPDRVDRRSLLAFERRQGALRVP
jgi:hypothetical protein